MIRCAVVGIGYWGPNIIRNLMEHQQTQVKYVVDLLPERINPITSKYPTIQGTTDYNDALYDSEVDAVFIVTPVATHYSLAKQALLSGKHVFVEKPMVDSVSKAEELVHLAQANGLTLAVDHTFVFTGAVRKIREIISSGDIGDPLFYDSTRINLGLFQSDVNVIWDLAPHDLSILDYLFGQLPRSVTAVGKAYYGTKTSMAYMTLDYGNMLAHLNLSWMSPVKLRTVLIGGSKQMIVYDDITPDEKIKVYDRGIEMEYTEPEAIRSQLISYRIGDVYSPKIDPVEALRTEIDDFVASVTSEVRGDNDGESGLRVVRILEAAEQSLNREGQRIYLK